MLGMQIKKPNVNGHFEQGVVTICEKSAKGYSEGFLIKLSSPEVPYNRFYFSVWSSSALVKPKLSIETFLALEHRRFSILLFWHVPKQKLEET